MAILFLIFALFSLLFGPLGWLLSFIFFSLFILTLIFKGISGTAKAMTRKKCTYCKSAIPNSAVICPVCRSQLQQSNYSNQAGASQQQIHNVQGETTSEVTQIAPEIIKQQEEMANIARQKRKDSLSASKQKAGQSISSMKEKIAELNIGQHVKSAYHTLVNQLKKLNKKQIFIVVGSIVLLVGAFSIYQMIKPGKVYSEDGNLIYKGELTQEKYDGQGILYGANGDIIYEGDFQNGVRAGKGESYVNGKIEYKGEWINDKYEGEGTSFHKNGEVSYQGSWEKDLKNGEGITYDNQGATIYNGHFKNDKYHGSGELYSAGKDILFAGEFVEGDYHNGEGVLFMNGKKSAEGTWENGSMVGEGITYYESGEIRSEGLYNNGSLIDGTFYDYFDNGELKETGAILDGEKNGVWKINHENGQLAYQTTYENGVKTKNQRWNAEGIELAINTIGNTNGNSVNDGLATVEGIYHYYSINDGDSRIVTNEINDGLTQLLNEEATHVNVIEDWVFFLSNEEIGKFHRDEQDVKLLLTNTTQFIVTEEFIFYITTFDELYRSDLSGENEVLIYSAEQSNLLTSLSYEDNKLFFLEGREYGDKIVQSINSDGTNPQQLIGKDLGVKQLITTSDGLYFYRLSFDYDYGFRPLLQSSDFNGDQHKILFSDIEIGTFNVSGDVVFFTDIFEDDHLYKFENGKVKQLNSDRTHSINLLDNEIIYMNVDDSNKVYRMDWNGENRELLN